MNDFPDAHNPVIPTFSEERYFFRGGSCGDSKGDAEGSLLAVTLFCPATDCLWWQESRLCSVGDFEDARDLRFFVNRDCVFAVEFVSQYRCERRVNLIPLSSIAFYIDAFERVYSFGETRVFRTAKAARHMFFYLFCLAFCFLFNKKNTKKIGVYFFQIQM